MTINNTKVHEILSNKIDKISKFVGNTPLYKLEGYHKNDKVEIYAKLEWLQMGSSVKARPAFNIFKQAVEQKLISPTRGLIDASSGNTGIAYATFGAALGIPVSIALPENASIERQIILKGLGANLILTPSEEGTDGSQKTVHELVAKQPELYYHANQYSNDNNWRAHYDTTAVEIWKQTNQEITHFVVGIGTSGTITGNTKRLRLFNPKIETVALQPDRASHGLEGWKHLDSAKMPPPIFDKNLPNRYELINTQKALILMKKVAQKDGLLISPSAAGNFLGAIQVADQITEGTIVTTFADDHSKYGKIFKAAFNL